MLWASLYRSVVIVVTVAGLIITWIAMGDPLRPLVMFTVQSNLMLAAYCCLRLVRPVSAEVKGAVTLYMLVTGLIWHFVRMGGANPFDDLGLDLGLGNFLLHYVTPVLTLADWLVFDRDGRGPRWTSALTWLAYPAAYLVFALVRGALLPTEAWKRYPYPFLDLDRLGYDGLTLVVAGLSISFALVGLVLVAAHRLVTGPSRSTGQHHAHEAADSETAGSQAGL